MPCELVRVPERAMAAEIGRGGAENQTVRGDPSHDERAVAQRPQAHRQVEALLDQVDGPVRERHVDVKPGVEGREIGDRG